MTATDAPRVAAPANTKETFGARFMTRLVVGFALGGS